MLNVQPIASFFIEESSKLPENDLTNLKLQKILFYAQAEALKFHDTQLFSDNIEAWRYGPVVPAAYDWLKGCGAYPITTFDVVTSTEGITPKIREILESVWQKYSKYSAGYLVDRTHEKGSPWQEVYTDTTNKIIPNDEVRKAKTQEEWQ